MIHHCNSGCSHGNHYHRQDYSTTSTPEPTNRPAPYKFQITDVKEYGPYQVVLVKYPGVTTFEGMKCLVVECSMLDLVKAKSLDPHFYDGKTLNGIKIIGRFPPDPVGVESAALFVRAILSLQDRTMKR